MKYDYTEEQWKDYLDNAARDEWYGASQIIESPEQYFARKEYEESHPYKDVLPDVSAINDEDVPF